MNGRRLSLLVGITILITTLITSPVLSASSSSSVIAPLSITVNYGSTTGFWTTEQFIEADNTDKRQEAGAAPKPAGAQR